jgi:hypothetical protein
VPFTLLFPYDEQLAASITDGEFLIQMLRTHSHVVFPGIAMPLV